MNELNIMTKTKKLITNIFIDRAYNLMLTNNQKHNIILVQGYINM